MTVKLPKRAVWLSTILAALGSGLIGGVFFAFSSFVMKGLAALPASQGIAAMQSINVAVISPLFMGVFLGTASLCVMLATYSVVRWRQNGSLYLLAGSLLYLFGGLLVTMRCNVPLNNALAQTDVTNGASGEVWAKFLSAWTFWNTFRGFGVELAVIAFIAGLYRARPSN